MIVMRVSYENGIGLPECRIVNLLLPHLCNRVNMNDLAVIFERKGAVEYARHSQRFPRRSDKNLASAREFINQVHSIHRSYKRFSSTRQWSVHDNFHFPSIWILADKTVVCSGNNLSWNLLCLQFRVNVRSDNFAEDGLLLFRQLYCLWISSGHSFSAVSVTTGAPYQTDKGNNHWKKSIHNNRIHLWLSLNVAQAAQSFQSLTRRGQWYRT